MVGLLGLVGCCSAVEYRALAVESRFELEARRSLAVVGVVLEDPDVWVYTDAPAVAVIHSGVLRPRVLGPAPVGVGDFEAAPARLREGLEVARRVLAEKGYTQATEEADAVVGVGVTEDDEGRVVRVEVFVGGDVDGRFVARGIALDAAVDVEAGCDAPGVGELVEGLVGVLPEFEGSP